MRKWMLYIAAFTLVISLFLGFLLQLLYRNVLFQSTLEEYGQKLSSRTIFSIKEELDQEFSSVFSKVEKSLPYLEKEHTIFNSILDDIAKESTFIKVISLKNKDSHQPIYCQENFVPTNHPNIYEFCKFIKNIPIYFYLDFDILKTRINDIYAIYEEKFQYAPIKIIFYQHQVLHLNLLKETVREHQAFILEAKKLIKAHKTFTFRLDGSAVFVLPIQFDTINIKDFFIFLGIAPYNLKLTPSMWFSLLSVFVLCCLFLALLLYWINNVFKDNLQEYSEPMVINSNNLPSKMMSKEYPELRSFIQLVTEQEKKYQESLKSDSHLKKSEDLSSYYKLMEQFSMIDYTILCKKTDFHINAYIKSKNGKEELFQIDTKNFFFPTILGKNEQSFYIYKDAGNTTPVKMLLQNSPINLDTLQGFILVALEPNWSRFIIYTTQKEMSHQFFIDIYQNAKKQLLK